MRIHGPLPTHLPFAPKRRNRNSDAVSDGQEQSSPSSSNLAVSRLEPELDAEYIAAGESFDFNEHELSAAARKALKGYWAVAQQGRFEWQRIDIYV